MGGEFLDDSQRILKQISRDVANGDWTSLIEGLLEVGVTTMEKVPTSESFTRKAVRLYRTFLSV